MFQFYLSSIKSFICNLWCSLCQCFNSTLVQLKVNMPQSYIDEATQFQFYLSSIKSGNLSVLFYVLFKFQFYLSSIKSGFCFKFFSVIWHCFNSTLVQLKVSARTMGQNFQERFNSTLVQLKAVKNANKYTSKSMIYHPFILIFYKHLQSTFNS